MLVYRIGRKRYARDLSGIGAWINGGRWNGKGLYALYTAGSASLAMLEWLVHAQTPDANETYCLTTIEIPPQSIVTIQLDELAADWRLFPAPEALQLLGNRYLQEGKWLGIAFPSVIMPVDVNIVLNPLHDKFDQVKIVAVEELVLDGRLYAKSYSKSGEAK